MRKPNLDALAAKIEDAVGRAHTSLDTNDLHWVQFIKTYQTKDDGSAVRRDLELDDGRCTRFGEWHLDASKVPDLKWLPQAIREGLLTREEWRSSLEMRDGVEFYDERFSANRTDRSVIITDAPTAAKFTVADIGIVDGRSDAVAYLIYQGKVVYEVEWSKHYFLDDGKVRIRYEDISGEPVTRLCPKTLTRDQS